MHLGSSQTRTVETLSTVHFAEQQRRGNATEEDEGEEEEQTTLRGGDVWLAVEKAEGDDEPRELLGRWTANSGKFDTPPTSFFSLQKYVFCCQTGLSVDN